MMRLFIAVDLGAGSGRVFLCGLGPDELLLEEIRRFHYPPRECDGHLRWDFARILNEIKTGLCSAGERARELGQCGSKHWGSKLGRGLRIHRRYWKTPRRPDLLSRLAHARGNG